MRFWQQIKNNNKLVLPEDMTKKQLRDNVLKIAWPAVTELVLVQLCSVVDTAMVGKLGASELTSVGYCTQPKFLLLAVFIALNSGTTALVARLKGQEDREQARVAQRQSLFLSLILALILSVLGFVFAKDMVLFMGAEGEKTIANATAYMQIQMIGFVFNALTLSITSGLRGIGKTRVSMYYNIVANVINVIFNYILIFGHFGAPKLGVAGASLATVIGQNVSFIIAVIVIGQKKQYLSVKLWEMFKVDLSMIKRILRIGVPALFEQLALRAGLIIYTLVVTSLGETQYATHLIGLNIMSLSFMNGQAFGVAATSLLGQSLGKKKPDEGRAYTLECRRMGMTVSILMSIVFLVFSGPIFSIFTDDQTIISLGRYIMIVLAINQPLQSSQLILSGALRGAGDTKTVAITTLLGMLVVRPATSYIAVNFLYLGLVGAWAAVVLDQVLRSVIVYAVFAKGRWQSIRV